MPHWRNGFGECHPGAVNRSVLVAFPIDKSQGFVQQKSVTGVCNETKNVYFDLQAASGVQTFPPYSQ
jgi:hypothetical protein